MAKYKLKTKKAAAKRFPKTTAKGNIKRGQRNHGHFLSKRGQGVRSLAKTVLVHDHNYDNIVSLMPYEGAKKKRTKAKLKALRQQMAAKEMAQTEEGSTAMCIPESFRGLSDL